PARRSPAFFCPPGQETRAQTAYWSWTKEFWMSECRLLILDESPESRSVISEALVDQGYLVRIARDENEAIQTLANDHPSLALVHVDRSTEDQLVMLRDFRERAPSFPILVMGGGTEGRLAAEQIGAIGYVSDPL